MSHQCIADAFAPTKARYKEEVTRDTWGHLAPKRLTYKGCFVFAVGCFGSDDLNPTVLEFALKSRNGEELDSSPWVFNALMDYLRELPYEAGKVYRWTGTLRNYKFSGTLRNLKLEG
jgi:hypothetical protein